MPNGLAVSRRGTSVKAADCFRPASLFGLLNSRQQRPIITNAKIKAPIVTPMSSPILDGAVVSSGRLESTSNDQNKDKLKGIRLYIVTKHIQCWEVRISLVWALGLPQLNDFIFLYLMRNQIKS